MSVPVEQLISFYREMLRIRRVELKIESLYRLDEMKTPIHLCIGQEAISAGVCGALEKEDPIFTTYRSHGQYLAKGGDLGRMIAELHCKKTGCSKGRGGSMHLVDLSVGHYGSSAIVGGCLPIATGMALSHRMKNESKVTAVFFGDGAADEGVFYESVNFAMLKRLPVIFVLEDNQWAVCSHTSARKSGDNVFRHADPESLFYRALDGNNVEEVFEATVEATERARKGGGPALLECATYRMRGHAGSGSDAHLGYRSDEEIAEWEGRCPLALLGTELTTKSFLSTDEMKAMQEEIDDEIEEAFAFARAAALPEAEEVLDYVYRS